MIIDHSSNKPLHLQAEEILRRLIETEEYKNGKLLPNEVELSEQLHISRNTLRQAINRLVFEGLLTRSNFTSVSGILQRKSPTFSAATEKRRSVS